MSNQRTTRRGILQAAGGLIVAGSVGTNVGASTSTSQVPQDDDHGAQNEDGDEQDEQEHPFEQLYRETIESVVLVQVGQTDGMQQGGLGSGFVYDESHILTNQHVVGGAEEVSIQFDDEQWRTGTVVGADEHSDLALVEIDDLPEFAEPLPITEDEPVIGREVVVLGNPMGLDASISQGIISGVDRSLPSPSGFHIPGAIQTDAAVNPGNSGGPLVTLDGEVLGVVFAGGGQNIGFAIPAALVERVVPELLEDGEYDHPYLGVGVHPVTPPVAEANDLEEPRGVLVGEIVSGSPADGVLQAADDETIIEGSIVPITGDVIVEIAGERIPNQERLSAVLALETEPGEEVEVVVIRDGERESVELTIGTRPDPPLQTDS